MLRIISSRNESTTVYSSTFTKEFPNYIRAFHTSSNPLKYDKKTKKREKTGKKIKMIFSWHLIESMKSSDIVTATKPF